MTDLDDEKDAAFEAGRQSAFRAILGILAAELHGDEKKVANTIAELIDVRTALRELGDDLGCEPWPENLRLGDVIEKRIRPTIETIDDSPCDRCDNRDKEDLVGPCLNCLGTDDHPNFKSMVTR